MGCVGTNPKNGKRKGALKVRIVVNSDEIFRKSKKRLKKRKRKTKTIIITMVACFW
jgi:hypothetical protein